MKYLAGCLLLLWQGPLSAAFVVPNKNNNIINNNHGLSSLKNKREATLLFSSPPEGAEEEKKIETTSFADAGKSLLDAEDTKRMEAMGDFDDNKGNPQADEIERIREAVRARAEAVGAKKDTATQQYIEEATKRAMNERANAQQPGTLDLSQISTGDEYEFKKKKANEWDESMPAMLYDPADELTEEEQAEADKVGQLPVWEQAVTEIKASKWPSFGAVIREVALMAIVVAVTGAIIINWDGFLRETYTGLGMIPRAEDIPGQMSDLDLPSGFTNNMNEDDLAQITQEMNEAGKAAGLSNQALNDMMESQNVNPDL